ncbi:MAG: flagellar basal body rod protein FlgB [Maricaulis sp.]|jgi:flagellar basal-body rod protein FlgB|nr:flagellar basal body rod protein FlgB [Maricaulis sp.]HAQ35417.1 flagellar basal body rod protein FlgB [Alphaproteobacteria bacterium]
MRPGDAPVLNLLRESLGFYSARQSVLADNIANADTPNFVPRDLQEADFHRALQRELRGSASSSASSVAMSANHPGHMSPAGGGGSTREYRAVSSPDGETTVNGNAVSLEEQMVRAQDNRIRYETALGLYEKSLGLIRMASRPVAR